MPAVARDQGAPPPAPTATPPVTPSATPPPTPASGAEITLQSQLDTAHAVSQLVTVAGGGTLTTTGTDGSAYTLTLPPSSVLYDVTVTMTPVRALGGLPASGGLKAGVQLEPDGMQLGVPATLDIVAASPVPVAQEISLSYGGNGRQAYAYGLGVNASRTRFSIFHFSGWAIAQGTDAQQKSFLQSKVDSASSQISQRLAPIISAERQRQLLGTANDEGSAEFNAAMQAGLEEAYRSVVQPAMDTAESLADSGGIDAVEPALQAFLSWERQLQLLGMDILQAERTALFQQMDRILEKVRKNMRDRCVNQHDISMAVRLMALARQQALLTGNPGPALDDAQRCLTFKLDFETVLTTGSAPELWKIHVRALGVRLPLGGAAPGVPLASAPLELLDFEAWHGEDCTNAYDVHVAVPFKVNSARLVWSTKDGKQDVVGVELVIEPGGISGSYTMTCPSPPPAPPFVQIFPIDPNFLRGDFTYNHVQDVDPAGNGYRIVDWDMIRGAVYARKTFATSADPIHEMTTFDLKHAPE